MLGAIQMRAERNALIADLAKIAEAENLEAARVRENRVRPGHKSVQPAHFANQFVAGTQIEMIGVRENDLRAESFEVLLRLPFHRRGGSNGHERRRLDHAVRSRQPPRRAPVGSVARTSK